MGTLEISFFIAVSFFAFVIYMTGLFEFDDKNNISENHCSGETAVVFVEENICIKNGKMIE